MNMYVIDYDNIQYSCEPHEFIVMAESSDIATKKVVEYLISNNMPVDGCSLDAHLIGDITFRLAT